MKLYGKQFIKGLKRDRLNYLLKNLVGDRFLCLVVPLMLVQQMTNIRESTYKLRFQSEKLRMLLTSS